MKILSALFLMTVIAFSSNAQRNLVPGKKTSKSSMYGGAADFNDYRPFGLQLSIGPTITFPTHPGTATSNYTLHGSGYDFNTTPRGLPGIMAEVGMLHLPTKRSKLSEKLKYIFISYIDWGVGVKWIRGAEQTEIMQISPVNQLLDTRLGEFQNLFATARVTLHKNFYIGKKYFIDNGFGINADFNLVKKMTPDYHFMDYGVKEHYFHHDLMLHFHYELGFGIRLNRRSMLVISAQAPIFGFHEWRKGAADFKWFDSNYYPTHLKVKWTYLFKQKAKGCAPARVNDQDKDTMRKN